MIFLRAEHAFPVFVDKETWCCECSWHQISIPHLLIIWSFSPFSNHSPSIFQAILMVFPCLSDDFPSCCSSNFSASIFSSDRWVQVSVPRSTCFATHPPPSMVLNHRDTKLFRTRFYPHHLLQLAWHGEKIGKKNIYWTHFCPLFFPQASSTLINPMVFWWLWPPNPTRSHLFDLHSGWVRFVHLTKSAHHLWIWTSTSYFWSEFLENGRLRFAT